MNRKGWDNLSTSYRRRLERRGITREAYARGDSLTRARGHFVTPSTPARRMLLRAQRAESEAWLRLRGRVRRLQAGESIRENWMNRKIRSPEALRDTVEHYEEMEARYEESGGEPEDDLLGDHSDWYDAMHDVYGPEFDYPDLDIYYHGNTKG